MQTSIRAATIALALMSLVPAHARANPPSNCSLVFDGIDDRVDVPASIPLPDSVFTTTAWIKFEGTQYGNVVSRGEDDHSDIKPWGLAVDVDGSISVQIETAPGAGELYYSASTVERGVWTHVGVTRDAAGTMRFYIGGQIDEVHGTTVDPGGSSGWPLQIGYERAAFGQGPGGQDPSGFFQGSLAEITVWSRPLSLTELQFLRDQTLPPDTSGLWGYWRLDEGQGQLVVDSSLVESNDGTLGDGSGTDDFDPAWDCVTSTVIGRSTPRAAVLHRIAPNPFNPATRITFTGRLDARTTVRVYDAQGRDVAKLFDDLASGNRQAVSWRAEGFPSGVYYIAVTSDGKTAAEKAVLLK